MIPGITASDGFARSRLITVTEGTGSIQAFSAYGYGSGFGAINVSTYQGVDITGIGAGWTTSPPPGSFIIEFSGDVTGAFFDSLDVEGHGNLPRSSAIGEFGTYDAGDDVTYWFWSSGTAFTGWDGTGTRTVTING